MDRTLRALLSPKEEATLRRIANGGAHPMSLRDRDVARLVGLGLVNQSRMGLGITPVGLQRLGRPPSAVPWPAHFTPGRFHP